MKMLYNLRMKYLDQKLPVIERTLVGFSFHSGNAYFTRLGNKLGLINGMRSLSLNDHSIVIYFISKENLKALIKTYKTRIKQRKDKLYGLPTIVQLVAFLKYIFIRNKRAKELFGVFRVKAYEDKNLYLSIALDIAKEVSKTEIEWFDYGVEEDEHEESIFKYIYYFEFKDIQISFHSDILYSNVPKFNKEWNGINNESFPIRITQIRKWLKNGKDN